MMMMMMMDDNTKERNTLVFVYIAIIELTFLFLFFYRQSLYKVARYVNNVQAKSIIIDGQHNPSFF